MSKFKKGDVVKHKTNGCIVKINLICSDGYAMGILDQGHHVLLNDIENEYEFYTEPVDFMVQVWDFENNTYEMIPESVYRSPKDED